MRTDYNTCGHIERRLALPDLDKWCIRFLQRDFVDAVISRAWFVPFEALLFEH